MDDPPGNNKSMDDMMFYEVNHVNDSNFCERYGFHPTLRSNRLLQE